MDNKFFQNVSKGMIIGATIADLLNTNHWDPKLTNSLENQTSNLGSAYEQNHTRRLQQDLSNLGKPPINQK